MMSDAISVIAPVTAKPGHEAARREAYLRLLDITRVGRGFVRYDPHQDRVNAGYFSRCENWRDQAPLDLHGETHNLQAHRSMLQHRVSAATIQTSRNIDS